MNPDDLKLHVRSFFEELFTQKETAPLLENLLAFQPLLPDDDHVALLQPAIAEEVR